MTRLLKKTLKLTLILCLTAITLVSCGKPGAFSTNGRTVMEVGGYDVTYDEYRYFYYNCMLDMGDDADFSNAETLALLKTNTETALRKRYAIKFYCDKYKREMSRADKEEMDDFIKSYIEELGGKDTYKQKLEERRMSGDVFREQYALTYYYDVYLRDLLFTGYDGIIPVDDNTVKQDVLDNFYRYTQIFIPFNTGSDYTKNQAKMEEALAKLDSGISFEDVAREYSQWTVDYRVGVYSTPGEKLEVIENTALALEIGEYSEIVFSSEGHHIIKRLPLEEKYINDNLDTLLSISATRRYNEFLEKEAAALTVEYKDYFSELSHGMLVTKK